MKIITLTLSPAVDVEFHLSGEINPSGLNRAESQSVSAGGKGINVSRSVLNTAKKDNNYNISDSLITIAPVGGVNGGLLANALADEGITLTSVAIDGNTRLNASVIPAHGKPEEINAPGTPIGGAIALLEETVLSSVDDGDCVVIAGSCPKDVDMSYPAYLIGEIKKRGGYVVLDCDGAALKYAVCGDRSCRPDLIKPNTDELGELTGMAVENEKDVFEAARTLDGITVITTMAGDGSVLTLNGESEFFPTEKRKVVRQKGAGDTFLGAFVYYYKCRKYSAKEAMTLANKVAGDYVAGE